MHLDSNMSFMSAMALNTVSMIKFHAQNRLFLEQSMTIHKDIQTLNLQTVKEREEEYVRRVTMLPNHSTPVNAQNGVSTTNTDNPVRITFFNKCKINSPCTLTESASSV